jgi:hypothetical protein
VRWHRASDLEDDLGAAPQPERARVTSAPDAVYVDGDGATERREPAGAEWLAPDTEETAECRSALVIDDATRVERPHAGAAARLHDAAEASVRAFESDRRRDDDDTPPREQLDVNTRTGIERLRVADEARGGRPGGWLVAGSRSHGRRSESEHDRRGREGDGAQGHRPQATRIVLCLLACILATALAAPFAKADGDPASDYLISQQVFLSYDAKVPTALQQKLAAAVASSNKNGYPVRVALIWSRYDLGSLPVLFGHPRQYARFLDAEDAKCWWGASCSSGRFSTKTRLLVVMPNGLGFAQWKHNPAAGYRTLAGIKVDRTPAGLATAATNAVVKLAAAEGVKASTSGGSGLADQPSSRGTSPLEIVVAVALAILLGAAALFLIRRRSARSALR